MGDSQPIMQNGMRAGGLLVSGWRTWVIAFGIGLIGGVLVAMSGHGFLWVGWAVGLLVGVCCALLSSSHRFLFGLFGVVIVVVTVLSAIMFIYLPLSPGRFSAWFVTFVVGFIVGLPGLAGAALVALRCRRPDTSSGSTIGEG